MWKVKIMSTTRSIRTLPMRVVSPANPAWVNRALKLHDEVGVDYSHHTFAMSCFGRQWQTMMGLRERFLPQLSPSSGPVRVLDIGIGNSPCAEVLELADHLMKAGINFEITAMDMRERAFEVLKQMGGLGVGFKELSDLHIPESYYATFLGKPCIREGSAFHFYIPKEVKDRIERLIGDIATAEVPQERFDIIICLNILIYLRTRSIEKLALYNMAKGLKSGGVLITDWHQMVFQMNNLNLNNRRFRTAELAMLGLKRIEPILAEGDGWEHFALQRT